MLYKFKSQATSEVIMLRASAEELLKIIGKTPAGSGIITAAQVPGAVSALKAEIQRREAHPEKQPPDDVGDQVAEGDAAKDETVSLRRRAAPFIDMLERSAANGKDVVWGV